MDCSSSCPSSSCPSPSSSSTAIVRVATLTDLPRIVEIYNKAIDVSTATFDTEHRSYDDRKAWFENRSNKHVVLVCEDKLSDGNGAIVGWASLNPFSDRVGYLGTVENSIYIDENFVGKGYGKLLMQELMTYARLGNFHTIVAKIADNNTSSIKLHEKYGGFHHFGTMKEVGFKFNRWIDVDWFQVML